MAFDTDYIAWLALHAEYTQLLDARDWRGLDSVFTDDVVYDSQAMRLPVMTGLDAVRSTFASIEHPIAHMSFPPLAGRVPDGLVLWSKWIVTLDDGRTAAGDYVDRVVTTSVGWRISRRVASRRGTHGRNTRITLRDDQQPSPEWWHRTATPLTAGPEHEEHK
jgi:hypothetical protein